MRNGQPIVRASEIIVEQQIEVDGSRAVALVTHSPQTLLDRQQHIENIVCLARGAQLGDRVQIGSLPRRSADRLCLVHRRYARYLYTLGLPEGHQRSLQVNASVAEVAAQGDVRRGHFSSSQCKI